MEENKVATRQSLHNAFENIGVKSDQAYRLADAVLNSPDLRIELRERPDEVCAWCDFNEAFDQMRQHTCKRRKEPK